MHEFADDNSTPPYAILSHTWHEGQEVSFQEMLDLADETKKKSGYRKIVESARQAKDMGYSYVWIDTCCIDKKSSSELSEAINSMFNWYKNSKYCFVYLADIETPQERIPATRSFLRSRWFKRGWTLQELIAPLKVCFFDRNWNPVGEKGYLAEDLSRATSIPESILRNTEPVESMSIAARMSWAANRETTRVEDIAYCLMGIFDVSMPLLYGEGRKAFIRLQEEIIRRSNDHSIFMWRDEVGQDSSYRGLLARSPDEFMHCSWLSFSPRAESDFPYFITNTGLQLNLKLAPVTMPQIVNWSINALDRDEDLSKELREEDDLYLPILDCKDTGLHGGTDHTVVLKRLQKNGHQFARVMTQRLVKYKEISTSTLRREIFYVRQDIKMPTSHSTPRLAGFRVNVEGSHPYPPGGGPDRQWENLGLMGSWDGDILSPPSKLNRIIAGGRWHAGWNQADAFCFLLIHDPENDRNIFRLFTTEGVGQLKMNRLEWANGPALKHAGQTLQLENGTRVTVVSMKRGIHRDRLVVFTDCRIEAPYSHDNDLAMKPAFREFWDTYNQKWCTEVVEPDEWT